MEFLLPQKLVQVVTGLKHINLLKFIIVSYQLIYCYDAYCTWCYGFSPVIKKIAEDYKSLLHIEVLSGGMILTEEPVSIKASAQFIEREYTVVEETAGVKFGSDYLWHIKNPEDSDWFPDSEKPAIALCIFKEYYPEKAVEFATDLEYSLMYEGRDLTDDNAYLHLLEKHNIRNEAFFTKLHSDEYKELARYEFALVKQLEVTGYPTLFLQTGDTKFVMIARGYTDYETVKERLINLLNAEGIV